MDYIIQMLNLRIKNVVRKFVLFNFLFTLVFLLFTEVFANQCLDYLIQSPDNELILVLDTYKIMDQDLFGQNRLAISYVSLASEKKLLEHSDPRLKDEQLIVAGGGLCGPICLTNIFLSKKRMNKSGSFRYWFNYTQDLVRDILDNYMWHTAAVLKEELHDPRMGTFLQRYLDGDNIVLENLGLRSEPIDLKDYNYNFDFLKTNDAVLMVNVKFRSTNVSPETGHAVIILGVDTKSKKLLVSDPNHPNEILMTPYKVENNEFIFYLWNENYVSEGDTSSVVLQSAFYITEE